MRLIRLFLNTLLFVFVFALVSIGSIGIYSAISYQSSDDYALIEFPIREDNVSYADSVMFWIDDISTNASSTTEVDTKIRVADWFDWAWWKNSMKNVDIYFIDPLVDIVKPIFLPITCVDEIRMYYGKDIADFTDYINRDTKSITDFTAMASIYFGVSVGFDDDGIKTVDIADLENNRDVFTINNLMRDIDGNGIIDMYDVSSKYNYYYQLLYKLHKYNRVDEDNNYIYEKYYNKFIFEDAAGRHIKSSVYGVYIIEIISLIFSIFFVYQNPISLERNENGVTEFRSPLRGFSKHRRKEK